MYMITKESLQNFVEINYGKTKRTNDTYDTVSKYCHDRISAILADYDARCGNAQLLREQRNDLDFWLRRYHGYCIMQRPDFRAHYFEVGVDENECEFEHLIPASTVRDLLLHKIFTINQAFNSPTVMLSRVKHKALKKAGFGSKTPDIWLPFKRYTQVFSADFKRHDGTIIDQTVWTLADHFNHFLVDK